MTDTALQPVASLDAIARAIAEHSRADEFPKYADDPSIYRGAVEGAIANLCKARGVRMRMVVYKIQNIAWSTAERAGTIDDVRAVLAIANDEINAIRENNAAADGHIQLGKQGQTRLPEGEKPMPKDDKKPAEQKTLVKDEKSANGGGLFGTQERCWFVKSSGRIYEVRVGADEDDPADFGPYSTREEAEAAAAKIEKEELPDNLGRRPTTPPAPEAPAASTDKPKCLNDWALDEDKRAKFTERITYLALDANIEVKNARAWALAILGVSDETQIATSASAALKTIEAVLPKPEHRPEPMPESTKPAEQSVKAVDAETGEILDAAIIPYEPARAVERAQRSVEILKALRRSVLQAGTDYGPQPGAPEGSPDVLKKPGAEKLANAFRYCPVFEIVSAVEEWDTAKPLFKYQYRCRLIDIETGNEIAEGIGSCNTLEKKYRWRWVQVQDVPAGLDKSTLTTKSGVKSEFAFAIEKAETTGKYGKPTAYWKEFQDAIANGTARSVKRATANGKQFDAWEIGATLYRIPNDEVYDLVNTVDKMAQKRALVAAVLIGCNASEFFTQDLEDDDAA